MQGGRKVTQRIPDRYSICQKINYIDIRKEKFYINRWKCSPRSGTHAYAVFLMSDAWKRFTREDTVDLFGTEE
jgi:hypothetical protein